MEARLHEDDPDLSEALDAGVHVVHVHPVLRSVFMIVAAFALTTVTTLAFGPNVGGFVAVLALSYAAMYSWQALRVCRGLRR